MSRARVTMTAPGNNVQLGIGGAIGLLQLTSCNEIKGTVLKAKDAALTGFPSVLASLSNLRNTSGLTAGGVTGDHIQKASLRLGTVCKAPAPVVIGGTGSINGTNNYAAGVTAQGTWGVSQLRISGTTSPSAPGLHGYLVPAAGTPTRASGSNVLYDVDSDKNGYLYANGTTSVAVLAPGETSRLFNQTTAGAAVVAGNGFVMLADDTASLATLPNGKSITAMARHDCPQGQTVQLGGKVVCRVA